MKIRPASNLACPLDGLPLSIEEKHCSCPEGHHFDIARQGYINLLPAQHKRSRDPGDSKEMIAARQLFFNAGYFQEIAEHLDRISLSYIAANQNTCILDAGCGEGYFLEHLHRSIDSRNPAAAPSLIGMDISKWAIIAATRRSRQITWLVGSNRNPPVLPESVDLLICMFGFPEYEAFKKILKPNGKILLADPGPEHLVELREIIYPEVRKSGPPDLSRAEQHGFRLVNTQSLTYKSGILPAEQIHNLLVMTPHLYRAPKEGKEVAAKLEQLVVTVDVVFRVLEIQHD
jgi:23S rRNA (guanine745-N1)-methyltransferase